MRLNARIVGEVYEFWGNGTPETLTDEAFARVGEIFRDPGRPEFEGGRRFWVYLGQSGDAERNRPSDFWMAEYVLVGFEKIVAEVDGVPARYKPIVARITEWRRFGTAPGVVAPEPKAEQYVKGEGVVQWNVGKRAYDVIVNDHVVASSADKQIATEMAAGARPLA